MEAAATTENACDIVDFQFDRPEVRQMVRAFVESELSPCAIEQFRAHEGPTVGLLKEALFQAVINEMVLRALATRTAQEEKE